MMNPWDAPDQPECPECGGELEIEEQTRYTLDAHCLDCGAEIHNEADFEALAEREAPTGDTW